MAPDLGFFRRHPRVRRLLVPAGGVLAFGLFLILTFPYDVLARRIEVEAKSAGADLSIGSLGGSGLVGVRARDVRLRISSAPGAEPSPELRFERADISPDLLSLILRRTSFGFAIAAYGGTARGHMALSNDPRNPGVSSFRVDARDLDVSTLPLREWGGLTAVGKLRLTADLPTLQPASAAAGSMSLSLEGGAVTGGTVMGLALPRTSLGHVEGAVAVEKGTAHVEKTSARGGDVDADVDGNVNLRPLLSLSQADLHVRFHPSDRWLNENPAIRGMMGFIQNARQGDGSYLFTFTGPLSRLQPRPGR
jgi:type II secretion system protein N